MLKLKLEVTHADNGTVVFKPLNHQLTYQNVPRRAVDQFKVGQTVEAVIGLPDQYPVENPLPCVVGEHFEMRLIGDKWYKRQPYFPHNCEPIQEEIQNARERVLMTGQPQVIARCGYVSNCREFIPYRRLR